MPADPIDLTTLVIALSVFAIIFGVWQGALLLWAGRALARTQKVHERLGLDGGARHERLLRLWHDGQVATAAVEGGSSWNPIAWLSRLLQRAGWKVAPGLSAGLVIIGALFVFAAGFAITFKMAAALAITVAVLAIAHGYVQHRINVRAALFERQFLDALHVAATSLRAGHPLSGAFRFVSVEVPPPVGRLFGEMCQRQEFGASMEEVMRDMAVRTPSVDVKLLASSVVVQTRSGGNLADVMERLAAVMRDRIQVSRRMRVLTAQTQLSKRVLVALPVVLFAVLNLVNPEYMSPLYNTLFGKVLLALSGVMVMLGLWVMNRLLVIDF